MFLDPELSHLEHFEEMKRMHSGYSSREWQIGLCESMAQ